MTDSQRAPLIAVLNGAADVLTIMEDYLRSEGFLTVSAIINDFKKGKENFVQFMASYNPDVVLYDVPPPYDGNITFLKLLLDTHAMNERCVILTTTNKVQLEKVTGEKASIEIVGKPYDLDLLVAAIRDKLKDCLKAA